MNEQQNLAAIDWKDLHSRLPEFVLTALCPGALVSGILENNDVWFGKIVEGQSLPKHVRCVETFGGGEKTMLCYTAAISPITLQAFKEAEELSFKVSPELAVAWYKDASALLSIPDKLLWNG